MRELSREEFCERLKGILASQFPDETVESATISADLEHSLSGNYVRGLSKRGSRYEAFLAVPDGESQDTVNTASLLPCYGWAAFVKAARVERLMEFADCSEGSL